MSVSVRRFPQHVVITIRLWWGVVITIDLPP
jgi:hypothetical protein